MIVSIVFVSVYVIGSEKQTKLANLGHQALHCLCTAPYNISKNRRCKNPFSGEWRVQLEGAGLVTLI